MRTWQVSGATLLVLSLALAVGLTREKVLVWLLQYDWITGAYVALRHEGRVNLPTPDIQEPISLGLDPTRTLSAVDRRFASVAIDSSLLVGGHWWSKNAKPELIRGRHRVPPINLSRQELRYLSAQLAPAYLRIGGTEADYIYYDLAPAPSLDPPQGYELTLTRKQWDNLVEFSHAVGFDLFFTVNAGPSARNERGAWLPDNAAQLLAYAHNTESRVPIWEFGNELNVYRFVHGKGHEVSGKQLASDLERFREVVHNYFPSSKIAGPASFILPGVGEPLSEEYGLLKSVLQDGKQGVDILTWHFYPQQSRRCWAASRRANPELLLEPRYLDELERWTQHIKALEKASGTQIPVWLGETGNAQCGGEPNVSDRYVGGLWWLDQLGLAAAQSQKVVIRQTLIGSHYGLLDEDTLAPRPDYFNTLLWKALMGEQPLALTREGRAPRVRTYAHCTARKYDAPRGAVTLLMINLSTTHPAQVDLNAFDTSGAMLFELTADSLQAEHVKLNASPLGRNSLNGDWMRGVALPDPSAVRVPPVSYSFVMLPQAGASACGR